MLTSLSLSDLIALWTYINAKKEKFTPEDEEYKNLQKVQDFLDGQITSLYGNYLFCEKLLGNIP